MNLCGIFHGLQLQSREQKKKKNFLSVVNELSDFTQSPVRRRHAFSTLISGLTPQKSGNGCWPEQQKHLKPWGRGSLWRKGIFHVKGFFFFSVAISCPSSWESLHLLELRLEEGCQEKGKHYKPVCLPGSRSTSLWRTMKSPWLGTGPQHSNNSRQPQLARAYASELSKFPSPHPWPSLCFT